MHVERGRARCRPPSTARAWQAVVVTAARTCTLDMIAFLRHLSTPPMTKPADAPLAEWRHHILMCQKLLFLSKPLTGSS